MTPNNVEFPFFSFCFLFCTSACTVSAQPQVSASNLHQILHLTMPIHEHMHLAAISAASPAICTCPQTSSLLCSFALRQPDWSNLLASMYCIYVLSIRLLQPSR